MKKASSIFSKLLAISLLMIISVNTHTQTLIDKIGGVRTDFTITTDSLDMQVQSQAIVKRGVSDFEADWSGYWDGAYGIGYGYGLQTYHLEFSTDLKLIEKFKYREGSKEIHYYYLVTLTDKNDNTLLVIELNLNSIKSVSNGEYLTTYSLDLNEIPMILLDKTEKIDIVLIRTFRK